MSKATDFINNKCYQLGNPVEPFICKADALEAISIACKEIEERTVIVYRQLCPCFQRGKCCLLYTSIIKPFSTVTIL